jgi:acetyl-CoA C-acetyltransferase
MLTDPFSEKHMGTTAENVATKFGIFRQEQDEFALESQRRAGTAEAQTTFAEEITPVKIPGKHPVTVIEDKHPRPDITMEDLQVLRPAFQAERSVTAAIHRESTMAPQQWF